MKWFFLVFLSRILGKERSVNKYLRKKGIEIGEGCNISSNIVTPEPYLIKIKDNVTISNDVQLITHDNSVSKVIHGKSDLFGKIKIGSNSFIGARSIIMYGVTLEENTIVAAGSIVTRSPGRGNVIISGVPAKITGEWGEFAKKYEKNAINVDGRLNGAERMKLINNDKILVKR